MKIDLTSEQLEDIITALEMRLAYIETRSVTLRASDAIQQGQHKLVRALEPAQKVLIARMELTREAFLHADTFTLTSQN